MAAPSRVTTAAALAVLLSAGSALPAERNLTLEVARGTLVSLEALGRAIDAKAERRPAGLARSGNSGAVSVGAECDSPIRQAAAAFGVPEMLALAIGQVESGGHPWAVNAALTGRRFNSPAEAKAYVAEERRQGVGTIDVGCLQVSLYWHPGAFETLDEAFDPARNAAEGLKRLAALRRSTGSWTDAVARYHGGPPEEQAEYVCRVLSAYRRLMGRPAQGCDPVASSGAMSLAALKPSEDVTKRNRLAQERLEELGFEVGRKDSVIGPATASALMAFQASRRLPRTGRLTDETLIALGLSSEAVEMANREAGR